MGSFTDMVRSVAKKLYEMDSSIIERMARSGETFTDWINPVFSYDKDGVKGDTKLEGTNIYISTGYSAYDCVSFIRGLLRKYDLDIEEDFVYSARSTKTDGEKDDAEEPVRYETRQAYWTYALPIIQRENVMTGAFSNCAPGKSNATYGSFGLGGFYIACVANYDQARILLILFSNQIKTELTKCGIMESVMRDEAIPDKRSRIQSDRGSGEENKGQECKSAAAGADDEP